VAAYCENFRHHRHWAWHPRHCGIHARSFAVRVADTGRLASAVSCNVWRDYAPVCSSASTQQAHRTTHSSLNAVGETEEEQRTQNSRRKSDQRPPGAARAWRRRLTANGSVTCRARRECVCPARPYRVQQSTMAASPPAATVILRRIGCQYFRHSHL
jgi:hypothetical protein